ncbi:MAG TPA: CoA-binding protein, partial [Candidatus Dormibacteraeota bacterium]
MTTAASPEVARSGLEAMLEARSVALVGASGRAESFGAVMVSQLLDGGFDGRGHLVNPRYGEIAGHRCVASLRELDEAP